MNRRNFVSSTVASIVLPVAGCLRYGKGSSGKNCDSVNIIRSEIISEGGKTSTPGTDTPTPVPNDEDYALVVVENRESVSHTLLGSITTYDSKKEYSRDIPAKTGTFKFRFGPFGHHAIEEFEFQIKNC